MKRSNLYLRLVTPSSGWWSPIALTTVLPPQPIYLQVDVSVLVGGDFVHGVDLEGDGGDVLAGVRLSADEKLVGWSQIREEGEELLQGVIEI